MKKWKKYRPVPRIFRGDKLLRGFIFSGADYTERNHSTAPADGCCSMDSEFRWKVISSYGRVLERCSSPVERECQLPFPKDIIRRAICQELFQNVDPDLRNHLEVAYAQLESFVPPEEFEVIQDFKLASSLAQEIAKSGEPSDIIASARILKKAKGDKAVKIAETISEKTRRRLEMIRSIGMELVTLDACSCSLEY
jgi:hypothetical protein